MKHTNCILFILLATLFIQCEKDNEPQKDPIISGTAVQNLIDQDATEETKTLFKNLQKSSKSGVILGQQQAYIERNHGVGARSFNESCDIFMLTQQQPLISGEDLEKLTNDGNNQSSGFNHKQTVEIKKWVLECHKIGVFVTFSWHFREPYKGKSFYTKDMSEESKQKAFKSILEGGENHTYYKKKLDLIANFFKSLKDTNGNLIPVIFRPFHEMSGAWFWWGIPHYATPNEFIKNWHFTVKYLRDVCEVHNVIYAFSPNKGFFTESEFTQCYPGNDYVDIVGFDTYEDYSKGDVAYNSTLKQLQILSNFSTKNNKLSALTECGYSSENPKIDNVYTNIYLRLIRESKCKIAYMMYWYNSNDKSFIPNDKSSEVEKEDFRDFLNSEDIFMVGDIESPLETW